MKHVIVDGPGRIGVVEATSPALPDGAARVQVAYVGVCHSDTARVREGAGPFPYRIGHEVSGTVVETSSGIPVGTRVAAYVEDGYATELVVPVGRIVPLHDDCSLLDGALAEPLACVVGAVEMLDLGRTERVTLVGAGFMGLLALRLLVARGLPVTVIEPRGRSRELALAWGAETAIHPDEVQSLRPTASVVVEATGSASGLQLASDLTPIAGTLGVLGYHQSGGGKRLVDMEGWNYRALRVLSLHHRDPADVLRWMDRAQRLAAGGIVVPGALVDTHVPLDGLPDVFTTAPAPDSIKAVLDVVS